MLQDIVAVVLNYRTPAKTLACLHSLSAEGISHIVLVENSEDEGVAFNQMRPGLEALREAGILVKVLDEGRNLGFATGVNRALACIQDRGAESVLLINSDATLKPGALAHLLNAIAEGADIAAPFIAVPGHEVKSPRFFYHKYLAVLTHKPLWGSCSYFTGACILLAPQVAHSHLFDEDFFFYGEDVMLGATMARLGKACIEVPDSVVIHEGSGSSKNGSLFYEYHINKGHLLLGRKLMYGKTEYCLALLGRMLVLPCRAIFRCVRFRCFVPLKGLWIATADFFIKARNSGVGPQVRP
ncbi:MAG: glycosyltransferase family 2 protein [Cellvibrionaceae bacterium]|nr:glycosyltransferase family 2 protein [Cellvibrionaceae bacterium]